MYVLFVFLENNYRNRLENFDSETIIPPLEIQNYLEIPKIIHLNKVLVSIKKKGEFDEGSYFINFWRWVSIGKFLLASSLSMRYLP